MQVLECPYASKWEFKFSKVIEVKKCKSAKGPQKSLKFTQLSIKCLKKSNVFQG